MKRKHWLELLVPFTKKQWPFFFFGGGAGVVEGQLSDPSQTPVSSGEGWKGQEEATVSGALPRPLPLPGTEGLGQAW